MYRICEYFSTSKSTFEIYDCNNKHYRQIQEKYCKKYHVIMLQYYNVINRRNIFMRIYLYLNNDWMYSSWGILVVHITYSTTHDLTHIYRNDYDKECTNRTVQDPHMNCIDFHNDNDNDK